MSQTQEYKVSLTNGSALLLRHLLNQTGWTKNIAEFIVAARLLAEVIPEPAAQIDRPHPAVTPNYKEELANWKLAEAAWSVGTVATFAVNEKWRDVIKACLRNAVEKQVAPPSKAAFDLYTAFGITE
jgi:hypothetical protein